MVNIYDISKARVENWFNDLSTLFHNVKPLIIIDSKIIDWNKIDLNSQSLKDNYIGIFTSGTTGEPKLIIHDRNKLLHKSNVTSDKWLSFYRPDRMAGLQAVIHAIASRSELQFLNNSLSLDTLSKAQSNYLKIATRLSGTPSHFRYFDLNILKLCSSLKSITLGGEPIHQSDINRLKAILPGINVYQVYASSEFGAMCTVKDELAGIPMSYFEGDSPRFKLTNSSELLVKPFAISSSINWMDSNYYETGDIVELTNERYHFIGRVDSKLNVNGAFVHPGEIENILRNLSDVSDCRVYSEANKMLGNLVVADIVPTSDKITKKDIFNKIKLEPSHNKPHVIRMVNKIPVSIAGKVIR